MSASPGVWAGAPTAYTYQWEKCNGSGGDCKAISGATGSKLHLTPSDVGHTIAVQVTARNATGTSLPATSVGVEIIAPATRAQIRAVLAKILKPTGRNATFRRIIKNSGFTFSFAAPDAGKLTLTWSASSKHKTVVVGDAAVKLGGAGRAKFKLALTAAGRKLLRHATRLRIAATASFVPTVGLNAVHASKSFTLKR